MNALYTRYIKISRKNEDLNSKEIKKFQENLCIKISLDKVPLYDFVTLSIVLIKAAA